MLKSSQFLTVLATVFAIAEGGVLPHHRPRAAAPAAVAACPQMAPAPNARAIYMQTNKSPNSIVSIPVGADGTLASGLLTATGGNGGNTVNENGTANVPDALSSQGSVEVADQYVFAVNAGSNSVSMLSINPANPAQLTLVGQPVQTGGDFPTSVAPSAKTKMVCVAHTGTKAGVSCASYSQAGIGQFDALRPFDLGQTNPPSGPTNGVGDCFFTEDSSALITTVKGDPTKNNPGFMSIIPASPFMQGVVSPIDAHFSPPGTNVLFGSAQIPGTSKILATDASFGFATIDLANPGAAPLAMTKVADQKATCWSKISPMNPNIGFVTDVGANHLISVDTTTGAQIQEFQSANGNAGMIDFVAAGNMVYALAPGTSTDGTGAKVASFKVAADGTIQDMQNVGLVGADGNAQGMAVLV